MAAGDVTIHQDSGRDIKALRFVSGEVQLNGGTPTPVALHSYLSVWRGGVVSLDTEQPLTIDPAAVGCHPDSPRRATLMVEAHKPAPAGDAQLVQFLAWGRP